MSLFQFYFLSAATFAFGDNVLEMEVVQRPLTGFKWQNCGTTTVPVTFRSFSIHPDSVQVGTNISISFDMEITKQIGTTKTLQADMELTLTTQGTSIDLCKYDPISKYCHSGDLCKILEDYISKCPDIIKKLGTGCKCPFKAGTYSEKNAQYSIPDVPVEGLFHAKVNVTESDGPVGCIEMSVCIGSC